MHRKTPVSSLLLFVLIISSLAGCDLIPQFSSSDTEPTTDIAAVHTGVAQEMMMKLTAEAMAATSLAAGAVAANPAEANPVAGIPAATEVQAAATVEVMAPTSTPLAAATAGQNEVASNQGAGLGKTRSEVALIYSLLEFEFELTSNGQGQEVYTGTVSDNLAVVKITGSADNISGISVDIDILQPADENHAARTLIYLSGVLSAGLEDWEGGAQWMAESLDRMGESRTTVNGREVVMNVAQDADMTHISFSITSI